MTRKNLSDARRGANRKAANRRYYQAHKGRYQGSYKANRTKHLAYDRMHRDLHRDAHLLRQKIYNDTKRKKS